MADRTRVTSFIGGTESRDDWTAGTLRRLGSPSRLPVPLRVWTSSYAKMARLLGAIRNRRPRHTSDDARGGGEERQHRDERGCQYHIIRRSLKAHGSARAGFRELHVQSGLELFWAVERHAK